MQSIVINYVDELCVVMSVTISTWNRCSVRLYLRLFVDGACLVYVICVCLRIVVSNTYCVMFLLLFFMCTLCSQFFRIVHLWLLFRYFLTFHYYRWDACRLNLNHTSLRTNFYFWRQANWPRKLHRTMII